MADYTLSARITGDASSFTKAFNQAKETLGGISEKVKTAGAKLNDFGKQATVGGVSLTAGITMPVVGAIKATADFDSAMRKAGAIAGASAQELDAMTKAALDLGAKTSLSASEVAVAMTEMAAKGFDANQTIAAMPGVIAAAEASGEDLAIVADTVSSALNGFRLEAGDATKVADILAMAANKTAAGVEDMSYAFKYAAPGAASLGISMEELAAATGIMTNAGLQGSQVGTTLRMAFNRLASPTKAAQKTMDDLGFSAIDANGNFKSLEQIVEELNKSMQGMTEAQKLATLSTIFGTEAASGMLILLSAGQEELSGLTKELENSAGASKEAADQMKAGIGGALENLSGAIESATISVMSQLTPILTVLAEKTTGIIEKFNGLGDGTKKTIAILIGLAAAAGPLLTMIGFMAMGFGGLVSTFGMLLNPIGLVIAAITALAAIFGYQMLTNDKLKSSFLASFSSIDDKITSVVGGIKGKVDSIFPSFSSFFGKVTEGFQSLGGLGGGFLTSMISMVFGLNPILKIAIMLFQNFGPQIISAFQQIAAMLLPLILSLGTTILNIAQAIVPVFISVLQTLIPIVAQVGMAFMNIIQMVLPVLISLINQLLPIISELVTMIAEVITQILPLVSTLVGALLPVITNIVQVVMNIIQALMPAVIAIIKAVMQVIQALLPIIISIITVVVEVISSVIATITPIVAFIGGIINAIVAIIAPIVTFIAGIIASIVSVIRPIINAVTGIFNLVFSVIAGVFRNIVTFVGSAINGISTVISGLSSIVSGVFNSIFSTVTGIMNRVSSVVLSVFNGLRSAWSGLTGFVGGIFSGIGAAIQNLVNHVKGFINNVIGGINIAVGLINKIPGVSISKIPYLARGTENWQGGFAYMNEGGRGELVNLPNGAQVIPHDVSMRYAREAAKYNHQSDGYSDSGVVSVGDINIYVDSMNVRDETDITKISRGLRADIDRSLMSKGVPVQHVFSS